MRETSQSLHVIIALILSYGFVKIRRCSACSVTVCVQAGIDSGFKFRLFIGCEGTYWIVLLLTIQGDDAGFQRGTMRN